MKKHLTLLMLAALLMSACATDRISRRPVVTTTIAPLAFLIEQIAGDDYDIVVLTPDGSSPETYQLTPRQLAELSHSQALFTVGSLGFEHTQLNKITQAAPDVRRVETADGLHLLHGDTHCGEDHGDPHLWLAPSNLKHMATNICHVLTEMDTTKTTLYAQRLSAYCAKADSLDAAIRSRLDSMPTRAFAIFHPALAYFARDYGLKQIALQHEGKEASPARMADVVSLCRENNVQVVFVQKGHTRSSTEAVARETQCRIVEINPLTRQIHDELIHIAESLNP